MSEKTIKIGQVNCGADQLFLISGPCVIEDENLMMETAERLVAISEKLRDSIIVGLALLGFGIVNLVMITHPLWFIVVSVLIYIPCAYWGGKVRVR